MDLVRQMLNFETFERAINLNKGFFDKIDELRKDFELDFGESFLYNGFAYLFDTFVESHFTDDGADLVFWWLYEECPKEITDAGEVYDVEDIKDFWNFLMENKDEYFIS